MPQVKEKSKQIDALIADLRDRVVALENEVADLKAQPKSTSGAREYLKSFGTVPDDETTRDAERLGRNYRRRQPKI
jgi:hypothetical protein